MFPEKKSKAKKKKHADRANDRKFTSLVNNIRLS